MTDYSSITAAVNWSTVGAGVIAISVLAVGVYAVVKGAAILISAVRGGDGFADDIDRQEAREAWEEHN